MTDAALEKIGAALGVLNPLLGAGFVVVAPIVREVIEFMQGKRADLPSVPKKLRSRAELEKQKLRNLGVVL